jgi:hypothetical protein
MQSPSANSDDCEQNEMPSELLELTEAIQKLPIEHRIKLLPSLRRVTESSLRRRRILCLVQEALGQLRLDMKYSRVSTSRRPSENAMNSSRS